MTIKSQYHALYDFNGRGIQDVCVGGGCTPRPTLPPLSLRVAFFHYSLLFFTAAPTDAAFLEEVSDIIHAAQLQNAIAKEKNKVLRIIGNSNEPRRQMYSRLVEKTR